VLSPFNPEFKSITLSPEAEHDFQIVAEFLGLLGKS
jgi:hypothetical protein